ncbi:hypothetical protein ACIRPK_05615 [Kitasatospora sp. NPDC101801]|uniref:hypothetical protein n=1 Tax=Kitasatospora sp. NPDC101801 TaxID=3364103 RepID=UPI0037F8D088
MRRWFLLPLLAVAALAMTGGTAYADDPPAAPAAPAASAAQTFGIQPATATEPDARGTFSYAATPGALLKDHVAVWNYGEQPLTVRLYPADAFNTDSGGYDVLPDGKPSTQAGSWLKTSVGSVTLPGRSRQIVPFTLAVPANAAPGDHAAGIVVAVRAESKDAKGNAVTVDQRVGSRVNIRVSGDLRAELKVENAKAVYHPSLNPLDTGRTTVSYTVRNTGNVRLGGKQAVRVSNVFGSIATGNAPADLQELLPGNAVNYSFDVSGVYPTLWGTAGITIDPLPVAGDKDPKLVSDVSKHRFALIPWTTLAALLLLALPAGRRWLNRRRRTPGAPATPSALPVPVAAAAVLLTALAFGQLLYAPRAFAAEPVGTLSFDYPKGHDDDAIDLLSSGPCPDPANYLAVRINGAGFPAEGAPLTGTVAASVYRAAPNGGFVLPLSNTLKVVATQAGSGPLKGEYTITASCRHKVKPASVKDFTAVLTFTDPTNWTTAAVAPAGMLHQAVAAEPMPTPAKGAAPAAAGSAAAPAADFGVPLYSWLAVTAGLLLLGWLTVPYVRRLRARRAAAEEVGE